MKILLGCQLLLLTSLLHLTAADAIDAEVGGFESPRALRSVYTEGVIRALRSDPEMETVRNTGIMRSRAVNVILRKFFTIFGGGLRTSPFQNHQ